MADDPNEAAKKRLEETREAMRREYEERSKGKPTPTQDENDRAAIGEHVVEKEPDGSTEEGPTHPHLTRQMEAQKPGGDYQVRGAKPAQPAQRPAPPRNE